MTDDQRFPLLVSHRSKLATLAINDAHKRTLHGGPTATVAEMRRQIWVTQAMKKASACIKKCVTCFRFNSGPTQQLMGDLPSSRIEVPERAFSCVGLDFAGPLTFKNGTECVKDYVAVFRSLAGWSLECCPKCVPTNVNPFKLQWNWTLLASGKSKEIPRVKPMSKENRQCEEHCDTTTYVADDGRITVCLPFKSEARPSTNFHTAKQRLFALERKLKDHGDVKQQYRDFIKEFVDMGHLEEAPQTSGLCYYLPHHCVFKDSATTKLRVVFDASSKSPNGNSLNDCLLLGPRLQDDVFDILIRFRLQYALSADVAKMYRQVGLDKSDRDFHRILWRDYVTDEIRELRMTRVTYGVASSSYHSTRALQESGKNHGPTPNTVNVILNDFWVDDLLSGADTLDEACVLQDNLIETLNKNCLPLRTWSSNEPQLVTRLSNDLQEAGKAYEINDKTHQIKTLGLTWHPLEDLFVYASSSEYISIFTN